MREEVTLALDIAPSAYMAQRVDSALASGAEAVEGLLHFPMGLYPTLATRNFDYPTNARTGRVYFDDWPLVSLTSITSGGVSLDTSDVFSLPDGRTPARWIDLDRNSSAAFSGGPQRAIAMLGLWGGAANTEETKGTLSASINTSVTTMTASTRVDVGSLLRIESERLLVTEKNWVTSAQSMSGSITASNADQILTVSDGTVFIANEEILLDAERMLVREVAGNTLIVKRASGGSTLAAHTAALIYWPRTLVVTRGVLGTTAASHTSSTAVYRWTPPALVRELNLAYGIDTFLQQNAGYARTVGSGDSERQMSVRGIRDLEDRCFTRHGRKARLRSV